MRQVRNEAVLAKMDGTSKLIFGFDPGLLSGKDNKAYSVDLGEFNGEGKGM